MLLNYQAKKRKISLTALIDVVFILLMFFMLTTQFIQWQSIPLELPEAENTQAHSNQPNIALLLNNQGYIQVLNEQQTTHNAEDFKHFSEFTERDLPVLLSAENLKLHPTADTHVKTLIEAFDHFKAIGLEIEIGAHVAEVTP